jgi:ferrous-iron efflux pump FieF
MTRSEVRRLTTYAAAASVATACLLGIIKGFAAWSTGSVAMLGSLADTGLDLIASVITLWGVRIAAQPADADHRFGHGKAEALAALGQVALISISAVAILVRAVGGLVAPTPVAGADEGIAISLVAILVTACLICFQRHVVRRTGSVAITADSVHYQSDLLVNLAVIAALVLDGVLGVDRADPVFGIAIALWLLWGAIRASTAAIDQLMDREWPIERRRRFVEFAATIPELKGMHDLRTRSAGSREFVQFHMFLPPLMPVVQAHDVMEQVELKLARAFPGVEILIHPDPEGHVDMAGALPSELAERPEV